MVRARWCGVWLSLVAACGGNVERGTGDPDGASTPAPTAPTPHGAQNADANADADTELGSCQLGRKEDWREPCPWVAEGRCYDDRDMACNCACPRSHNSQCASGFEEGPDGHVWVSCD